MRQAVLFVACGLVLAGCLGGRAPEPRRWLVEAPGAVPAAAARPVWGSVRVARLAVSAPYDGQRLAVRRADGTLALDGRNVFAATPGALLRLPTREIVRASGLAREVLLEGSSARADATLEIEVDILALDCTQAGTVRAQVALEATLLADRRFVQAVRGSASVPADGNFTAAFSSAYAQALTGALKELGACAIPSRE